MGIGRAHFGGTAARRHGRTIVRTARREMLLITTAIVFDSPVAETSIDEVHGYL